MRNCLIILYLCVSIQSWAQHSREVYRDSLITALENLKDARAKIDILSILTSEYADLNVDSAMMYAYESLSIAEKNKNKEDLTAAYENVGVVHYILLRKDSSVYYYEKALTIYEKQKDSLGIGSAYLNLANTYKANSELSKSLQYYYQAQSVFENLNHKEGLLILYSDIGELFLRVEERSKAMEYYEKALKLNKEIGSKTEDAFIKINLASVLIYEEEYDRAIEYCKQAQEIYEEEQNLYFINICNDIIAECLVGKKEYTKALELYQQSFSFYESADDDLGLAAISQCIGQIYLNATEESVNDFSNKYVNYRIALRNFENAKAIYDNAEADIQDLIGLYESLSQVYEKVGRENEAFELYKKRAMLLDSLHEMNEDKKVAKLDAERAIEVKNKELELQKIIVAKKRNERGFLIGGIAILLLGIVFIYYNYRERGKTNMLLAEEKNKSEELLLNILPEEVADELKEKGSANATHFDEVTVLFTDFVNFSKASERMSSQELVDELHTCFKAFDEITSKYHIEKIKTIGDAYLAVSGLPAIDKHHAENVVSAAKEILEFTNNRLKELGDKTFEIRIGVHSGDVVAGIVGVKKFAYDIWGDTVNTAARMEQNSKPGKINISQTTYELVKDKFNCAYRGELEAKNKGKLKMYFVET